MKKNMITFMLIISALYLFTEINFSNNNGNITINFENERNSMQQKDIYKTIALPALDAEISVNSCEISIFSKNGEHLRDEIIDGASRVEITDSFIMRDLFGHQVRIKTSVKDRETVSTLKSIDLEVKPVNVQDVPTRISKAFLPVYKSFVDNFETSYLRDATTEPARMLIITFSNLAGYFDDYVIWKNAKGTFTEVVTLDETGSTSAQIKSYLQNLYDNSETPPDFLLLTGDVDAPFEIPSFYISAENDVTDHPYTLLAGEDYFPEMIVGRFSIDAIMELWTILNKQFVYEKTPYMENTDWFTEALLVAGNYSTSPPTPTTPKKVSKWLKDKMVDYGYTEIDEIYYPPTHFAAPEINAAINEGVGFVSYRGWGDANGWHYPEYHIDDLEDLNNGEKLPVVTSIVCNTVDFANNVDPCFGEVFFRDGSPTLPKGCVAIVGPSDLYTHTKLNNSIFSGFYYGLLNEDILTLGLAVLRGKLELYNNFPLDREPGGNVEFYFHVYNILGDPSLSMWTKIPTEITCTLPSEVTIGISYLDVSVPDLEGGIITAMKTDEFYNVEIIDNGQATMYFDSLTEGTIQVTITKPNHIPLIQDIDVVSSATDVGLYSYQTDTAVISGEDIQLEVNLKNFGSQTANSITAVLSSENEFVNITDNSADFGNIGAGATSTQNFQFEVLASCPDNEVLAFDLDISDGCDAKLELIVSSLIFEVTEFSASGNNYLDLGANDLDVTIGNIGTVDAVNLQGTLTSLSDAASVGEIIINFGDVAVGGTSMGTFPVDVEEDCFIGRNVSFELNLFDDNGLMTSTIFTIVVGNVDNTHPTGHDSFGYFAYDSFDAGYEETPTYEWIEIDPDEGGNGSVFLLPDDQTQSIDLPFDFKFYGTEFDSISICTNGWISFVPTWETNFRNWNIPAALGPYAMVAAFWDDLIGEEIDEINEIYADMRICHYYDQVDNTFIIEWNECYNRDDNESVEKFEIILYDPDFYPTIDGNGEIQINYFEVHNIDTDGNYCTVGIENPTQSDGILYTYANIYPASATELQQGLAIKFTTDPPDEYTLAEDETISDSDFKLLDNFPNPFRISTNIFFNLTAENGKDAEILIYNMKGQKVKSIPVILNGIEGLVEWNGRDESSKPVSSGIYFYKLVYGDKRSEIKKCLLVR